MSLDKILSFLNLSLWQVVVLGGCSALLLFDPFGWIPAGLGPLQVPFVMLFGIAFLNLVMIIIDQIGSLAIFLWSARKRKKRLAQLTPDEKLLLQAFIFGNTRLVQMPMTSGVATRLVETGVFYIDPVVTFLHSSNWQIRDWAWTYLHKHKDLLTLSAEEEEQVNHSRIRGEPW